MAKLSRKKLAAWEKTRDLNAELSHALGEMKPGEWARKTEFTTLADGSVRRVITRRDGTIEKDETIPAEKALVMTSQRLSPTFLLPFIEDCSKLNINIVPMTIIPINTAIK